MRLVYFAIEQEQNFGVMTGKDHLPNILEEKSPIPPKWDGAWKG
jgi:hypothetical protein